MEFIGQFESFVSVFEVGFSDNEFGVVDFLCFFNNCFQIIRMCLFFMVVVFKNRICKVDIDLLDYEDQLYFLKWYILQQKMIYIDIFGFIDIVVLF